MRNEKMKKKEKWSLPQPGPEPIAWLESPDPTPSKRGTLTDQLKSQIQLVYGRCSFSILGVIFLSCCSGRGENDTLHDYWDIWGGTPKALSTGKKTILAPHLRPLFFLQQEADCRAYIWWSWQIDVVCSFFWCVTWIYYSHLISWRVRFWTAGTIYGYFK